MGNTGRRWRHLLSMARADFAKKSLSLSTLCPCRRCGQLLSVWDHIHAMGTGKRQPDDGRKLWLCELAKTQLRVLVKKTSEAVEVSASGSLVNRNTSSFLLYKEHAEIHSECLLIFHPNWGFGNKKASRKPTGKTCKNAVTTSNGSGNRRCILTFTPQELGRCICTIDDIGVIGDFLFIQL